MPDERIRFAHPGPRSVPESQALGAACQRVIDSNSYILGAEVQKFENAWAQFVGAPASVGVASGLDALEIGLVAVGIEPGDEVIVPAISAMASALAVHRAGATPVFCDVDQDTALMNGEHARSLVTDRTRAILPVHLYGRAVDMPSVNAWAQALGLKVVEDAAQAHGAMIRGRNVGTWGDASGFSFYPTKNLGAAGDAGAVVSLSLETLEKARALRNYGQVSQYEHEWLGMNSRLDEMQAAILSVRLRELAANTAERQLIAGRYFAEIRNEHVTLMLRPTETASYVAHLFVVRTAQRGAFIRHMETLGIECLVHYPRALPDQTASQPWNVAHADTPVARSHAATCVSLPCRPGLTSQEIDRVIEATNAYRP